MRSELGVQLPYRGLLVSKSIPLDIRNEGERTVFRSTDENTLTTISGASILHTTSEEDGKKTLENYEIGEEKYW